jgi:hypothetical protein
LPKWGSQVGNGVADLIVQNGREEVQSKEWDVDVELTYNEEEQRRKKLKEMIV